MHFTTTLVLAMIASVSVAAPLSARAGQDINKSNQVKPGSSAKVLDNGDGSFTVAGLKPTTKEIALEIACLSDFSVCKKDSKRDDKECSDILSTCETNNKLQGLVVPANSGTGFGGISAEPDSVKFVVDRQRKHFDGSLPPTGRREEIRLEGSESLIIDEGNGFFSLTNGDIISQSIEIISELGCLFDEKKCLADGKGKDCAAEKRSCDEGNGMSGVPVLLNNLPKA